MSGTPFANVNNIHVHSMTYLSCCQCWSTVAHTGSAANWLCLAGDPQWGYYDESVASGAKVSLHVYLRIILYTHNCLSIIYLPKDVGWSTVSQMLHRIIIAICIVVFTLVLIFLIACLFVTFTFNVTLNNILL